MAVRTLSAMRSAARPVGAARAMRGGGLPACRAWATSSTSMRVMVVVLLVPGPPVTRRRSEEHTSELQSLMRISYAVFCLKKKTTQHATQRRQDALAYR